MKFILYLVAFILLVFIKIGDSVLFALSLPFIAIKKLAAFLLAHTKALSMPCVSMPQVSVPRIPKTTIHAHRNYWFSHFKKNAHAQVRIMQKILRLLVVVPTHIISFCVGLIPLLFSQITKQVQSIHLPTSFSKNNRSAPAPYLNHRAQEWRKSLAKKQVKAHTQFFSPLSFFIKFKYFFFGITFSFFFLFLPLLMVVFIQNLPDPTTITSGQISQTTKIYDRNGILLYQIYASQNRTLVPLAEIPKNLQNATIAIEDKDFYKHPGFDVTAIIRSIVENASGKSLQGGSTLTQQLIKSTLLTPETSLARKVKEAILAFWTERLYTKQQILEMYFNYVPYGGTAWGVQSASQIYFGKSVKDLNLAESAFLAGIPRAPTIYSPYSGTTTLWKNRQKEVLHRMVVLGYITQKQADAAARQELVFQSPQIPIKAPHFVMYLKDLLIKKYGLPMVEKGGLKVITSLDLKLNEDVQKIVTAEVDNSARLLLSNGAALVTNPKNGDVLAMIGSHDFQDQNSGNVNLATSLRQPGSSIKPVTYAAAMIEGMTAATILDDSPITYPNPGGAAYSPVNYDGKFHGRIPLRVALGNSFNIPAVKTINQIGVPSMVTLAKKMGIKSWGDPDQYGLSITLGAAEASMVDMATVFGTLANNGTRVDVNPILKITDAKGTIIEEKEEVVGSQVLDPGIAFIISDILADNSARAWAFGPNSILNIPGQRVSVKTGTSDNKRDNWTIGYTQDWLVATWVGNNDGRPMSQSLASGITGAAPIWSKVMTKLLKGSVSTRPAIPENVMQKPCLGRLEYFIKGTENSVGCAALPPSPSTSPSPSPAR